MSVAPWQVQDHTPVWDRATAPRMYGRINGIYIPTKSIEVTQSSYGVADTASVETYLEGQTHDFGALSQRVQPVPFQVMAGYISRGRQGNFSPLLNGLLDEIDNEYETDVLTFHARGILANLVDTRLSITPNMNDTAQHVIQQVITKAGLTAKVASDPMNRSVGAILRKDDYVTGIKNMRALDFIHAICRWVGWTTRAVGNTVVVGPPPDPSTGPKLVKAWDKRAGMKLKVTHNALHNRNIKVKVISYIQAHKARSRAKVQQSMLAQELFPGVEPKSSGSTVRGGTGHQSGTTTVGERDNIEEYVIPVPNATDAECIALAQVIADEINRHEFLADFTFTPTPEEFATIVQYSPDFTVQLTGCAQASNNGLYYPKEVNWSWAIGDSAPTYEVTLKMVNHPLPAPAGGLPSGDVSSSV